MPLGSRFLRASLAVACGAVITVTAACTPGATASGTAPATKASATPTAPPAPIYGATVAVKTSGPVLGETSDQLVGLSFESGRLNTGLFDNVGDVAALLRNLGTSVMRFGGNSVDTQYHAISPAALAGLARLAQASGWSVLFSEPLAHFNAAAVTSDAQAVSDALGGQLAGFACGNEPDLYHVNGLRPARYAESTYLAQAARCFQAIRAGAPGTMLEGPDLSSSLDWLSRYASAERGVIGWLGEHEYPMGCLLEGDPPAQLAEELLSPALAARENTFFRTVAADARSASAAAHITETSDTCDGGADGMSNTYATALWVVQYLLNAAEHGIAGMNFHGGLTPGCQYFTPLCMTGPNEYAPMPIYYGMLFTHLLGDGQLLPATATADSPALNLAAFALRPYDGGLRVLIENLGRDRAATSVRAGGTSATALTMTAPALLATSGVRIQGAKVAANGTFTPGPPTPVACPAGTCRLTIQPYSAVLLTVR